MYSDEIQLRLYFSYPLYFPVRYPAVSARYLLTESIARCTSRGVLFRSYYWTISIVTLMTLCLVFHIYLRFLLLYYYYRSVDLLSLSFKSFTNNQLLTLSLKVQSFVFSHSLSLALLIKFYTVSIPN